MDNISKWHDRKLKRLQARMDGMDAEQKRKIAIAMHRLRRQMRLDAKKVSELASDCDTMITDGVDDEKGAWRTTQTGKHIFIQNGEVTKGNAEIVDYLNNEKSSERNKKSKKNEKRNSPPSVSPSTTKGSSYTKTFKTNDGVSFPKIKEGAVWDEDTLKEVNRLAREGNFNKEYDEIVKSLSEDDIVYQQDPEGITVASIPGLSQKYNNKVVGRSEEIQREYDRRIENGKKITEDMIDISNSLGSRMMGLENCFKGGESTSGKIDRVKIKQKKNRGEDWTDEEALAYMDDIVRYTYKCDHNNMAKQVVALENELKKRGYEIIERDNKFLPQDGGNPRNYKAVHLQAKSPDGERIEIQIHSEETIKTKNKNHQYFEKQRELKVEDHPENQAEHDRLEKIMVDNTAAMREPDGIMDLPSFKKR